MQYVNDDMDDVFRKAAEHYPLDTSGADWNKVLAKMDGNEEAQSPAGRRDNRRYLWLLMLLPLGLVCNYYYEQKTTGDVALQDKNSSTENSGRNQSSNTQSQQHSSDNHSSPSNSVNDQPTGQINSQAPVVASEDDVQSAGQNTLGTSQQKNKTGEFKNVANKTNAANRNNNSALPSSDFGKDWQQINAIAASQSVSENGVAYSDHIASNKFNLKGVNIQPDAEFQNNAGKEKKNIYQHSTPKRFYLGLMAGLDKTTIEFQKTTKNGFDYGALAGYKIGNRWSVEAAAFLDKKYYYSDGKYYKGDGSYMPPNTWITDINGYCRMWDLSLGGSYAFSQNSKSSWFAAAGMSSYIMKKENYDYTYYYASTGYSAIHNKVYNNASKDMLAIVNLSIGYTHRLAKNTDFRIEPYAKVPLKGVGAADLSLFSAGVHIGVTHKLF